MTHLQTIEIIIEDQVATIWLNRPEVHNAFNHIMVNEIYDSLEKLAKEENLRVLVIRGRGKSFCAGADLNWMREVVDFDYEKNLAESLLLAKCLRALYRFPLPVISIGHGSVIGGGNGLIAAADFAIATKNTQFAFSEVTIGLVPAVISSFIIRRLGESKAKELMLWGSLFKAEEAERWGLVNSIIEDSEIDNYLFELLVKLKQNSPQALKSTKELIINATEFPDEESILRQAAKVISHARISKEGQEGMKAFLEKRRPGW